MSNNTSVESKKHPYQRLPFWLDPENHFWECNLYSEEQKEYFRNWLRKIIARETRLSSYQ